jgi:hypothetical protein
LRAQDAQLLSKINEWSEAPARAQAEAISANDAPVAAATPTTPVESMPAQAAKPLVEPKTKRGTGKLAVVVNEVPMPWEKSQVQAEPVEKPGQVERRYVGFRLPVVLHQALNWLGGTTYQENASTIAIQAIEDEVNRRMEKLNLPLIPRTTPLRK